MDLENIANNLRNDIPKIYLIYLKRIDFTNTTSSSIESNKGK